MPPNPPAAVAVVCTIEFSFGPKLPPKIGNPVGKPTAQAFKIANPKIAPNRFAEKIQPVFNPASYQHPPFPRHE